MLLNRLYIEIYWYIRQNSAYALISSYHIFFCYNILPLYLRIDKVKLFRFRFEYMNSSNPIASFCLNVSTQECTSYKRSLLMSNKLTINLKPTGKSNIVFSKTFTKIDAVLSFVVNVIKSIFLLRFTTLHLVPCIFHIKFNTKLTT